MALVDLNLGSGVLLADILSWEGEMTKRFALFIWALFLLNNAVATDYSKCMNFLDPRTSHAPPGSSYSAPNKILFFRLRDNGKVEPNSQVLSYTIDKNKKQEVVNSTLPAFALSMDLIREDIDPVKDIRSVKSIIQRDENGNIIEIRRDLNLSSTDLKRIKNRQEKFWKQKNKANPNAKNYYPPVFSTLSHHVTKFEARNGQCVPVESQSLFLTEPKKNGKTATYTHFNLNLCKDIKDFFQKNPDAESCFRRDLNRKMTSIFSKYSSKYLHPAQKPSSLYSFSQSLERQIDKFAYMRELGDKNRGKSPVIAGNMILQKCRDIGLGPFLNDPSIWKKTKTAPKQRGGAKVLKN